MAAGVVWAWGECGRRVEADPHGVSLQCAEPIVWVHNGGLQVSVITVVVCAPGYLMPPHDDWPLSA